MSFEDEVEAAKLAALVSDELKKIDSFAIGRSSRGPANKLDPRSFIKTQPAPTQQVPNFNQQNRPIQPEEKISVNVSELMITPEDPETKKAMEKIIEEENKKLRPAVHIAQPVPAQPANTPPAAVTPPSFINPKAHILQQAEASIFQVIKDADMNEIKKFITYTKNKIKNLEKSINSIIELLNKSKPE